MFFERLTGDVLTFVRSTLLLVCAGLLLAFPAALGGSKIVRSAAAPARATASLTGSERKPVKGGAKVRRTAKPARKAAKPPRRRTPPAASSASQPSQPNDPLWGGSWSLGRVNAPAAWRLTTGRPEVVVAVLDTGADLAHPDLQGAFVAGYDVVNRDADPSDDHGHGTMVSGVIAARSNNGLGVTSACWRCSVMPVKVIGADGSGSAAAVAEGIVWATEHGAHVINLSFTLNAPDGAVAAAIEQARARGVVVVAAAGNSGTANASYPAAYPGVVSVAGTDPNDARYAWSSYGGWVRFAAPGCSLSTAPGGSYGEFCGTSSATAFVSGIAGLLRSSVVDVGPGAIEHALAAGTAPVGDVAALGRVDAGAAVTSLAPPAVNSPRTHSYDLLSESNS